MDIEERIWELAAKKLVQEASDEELKELTCLLQTNSVMADAVTILFDWWELKKTLSHQRNSRSLFKRISKTIKKEELKKQNIPVKERNTI